MTMQIIDKKWNKYSKNVTDTVTEGNQYFQNAVEKCMNKWKENNISFCP
jgi:hypothetical protein